ncbi:TPA: hypothetical protein ACX6SV_000647 [Photobacterium damselae]
MKLIFLLLTLFSYSVYADTPIVWRNNTLQGGNIGGIYSINLFNIFKFGNSWIGNNSFIPIGVASHITGLEDHTLTTRKLGFNVSKVVGEIPVSSLVDPSYAIGNAKVYKLSDQIGVAFIVSIRSFNTIMTADADHTFTNLPEPFAKINDSFTGFSVVFVKIGDIPTRDQFKPYNYSISLTGQIELIGKNSRVVSPPVTVNYNANIPKQVCGLTLNKNEINFNTITDSQLKSGLVSNSVILSSSCGGNIMIHDADIKLMNVKNGILYSNDNNIGFKLLDKNNMLLTKDVLIKSEENNYELKFVPFANSENIYGNHKASLNFMVTYK